MGYAAQTKGEQDGRKLEGKITEREMERSGKKRQNRRRDGKFMRDTEAETESEGQSDGHLKRQRQTEN